MSNDFGTYASNVDNNCVPYLNYLLCEQRSIYDELFDINNKSIHDSESIRFYCQVLEANSTVID